MSWTDERVERLSTLWLEGRSASQIAAELGGGVSRNAVIGKVHRLGLSGRAVPPSAVPPSAVPPAMEAPPRAPEAEPAPTSAAGSFALDAAEGIPAVPPSGETGPAEAAPVEVVPAQPVAAPVLAVAPAAPAEAPAMSEAPAVAVHTMDDVASILDAAAEPITVDLPALRAANRGATISAKGAAKGAALDVVIPITGRVTILELSGSMCRWPIGDPTSAEFRFCGCRAVGTYCQDHARVAFQPVADRRRTERLIRIA